MPSQAPLLQLAQRVSQSQRYDVHAEDELGRRLIAAVSSANPDRPIRAATSVPLSIITDSRLVFVLSSRLRTAPWAEAPETRVSDADTTVEARGVCSAMSKLSLLFLFVHALIGACCSGGTTAGSMGRQALEELIKQVRTYVGL